MFNVNFFFFPSFVTYDVQNIYHGWNISSTEKLYLDEGAKKPWIKTEKVLKLIKFAKIIQRTKSFKALEIGDMWLITKLEDQLGVFMLKERKIDYVKGSHATRESCVPGFSVI